MEAEKRCVIGVGSPHSGFNYLCRHFYLQIREGSSPTRCLGRENALGNLMPFCNRV